MSTRKPAGCIYLDFSFQQHFSDKRNSKFRFCLQCLVESFMIENMEKSIRVNGDDF